jgi:hypothetical protein
LHTSDLICYSSPPASAAHDIEQIERVAEKEEVDELSETLHNLTSLLLTNTTIRGVQQGSTGYRSLTINSR